MFLVAEWIGNYINKNGRVKVKLVPKNDNQPDYSLNVDKIKSVWFDGQKYYIEYDSGSSQWYKQNFEVTDSPKGVKCEIKITEHEKCPRCKRIDCFSWEDHWHCEYCGCPTSYTIKRFNYSYDRVKLLQWLIEQKINKKTEYVGSYFANSAGGTVATLGKVYSEFKVRIGKEDYECRHGEKLILRESHWDDYEVKEQTKDGEFVIVTDFGVGSGWEYHIFYIC